MAMPKKGTRRIVVASVPYLWAATQSWYIASNQSPIPSTASSETHGWYKYRLRVSITVQLASDDRFKLRAQAEFPNTIMVDDYPEDGVIRPRHVAALIDKAHADNWPGSAPSQYQSDHLSDIILNDVHCGSYGSVHDS